MPSRSTSNPSSRISTGSTYGAISTLESLRDIALEEGINYVYMGNVPGHEGENTYCPRCRSVVIQRYGMQVKTISLSNGEERTCHNPNPRIWDSKKTYRLY